MTDQPIVPPSSPMGEVPEIDANASLLLFNVVERWNSHHRSMKRIKRKLDALRIKKGKNDMVEKQTTQQGDRTKKIYL